MLKLEAPDQGRNSRQWGNIKFEEKTKTLSQSTSLIQVAEKERVLAMCEPRVIMTRSKSRIKKHMYQERDVIKDYYLFVMTSILCSPRRTRTRIMCSIILLLISSTWQSTNSIFQYKRFCLYIKPLAARVPPYSRILILNDHIARAPPSSILRFT